MMTLTACKVLHYHRSGGGERDVDFIFAVIELPHCPEPFLSLMKRYFRTRPLYKM